MNALTDGAPALPDQLQREARVWVRLLALKRVTQEDLQVLRHWRLASVSHEQAFVEAQRWWNGLNPAMAQLLSRNKKLAASLQEPRRPAWGRRAFLGGAVGVAAVAGATLAYSRLGAWSPVNEWRADYHTAAGEQRRIAMTDHVSVEMNTLTAVTREKVGGRTVGIELISGEAAIDLSGPRTTGFSVAAGVGRSIAEVGRFEVRHTDRSTCVTCVQGTLRVEHPLGMRMLAARQQVVYDPHSLGTPAIVDLATVSAWRKGMLVFKQTPLAQVIEEINRYRSGRVVLLNAAVRNRRVSGRFPIDTIDAVLLQIQHAYELKSRKFPGGLLVLS